MLDGSAFGAAGREVVIESYLEGIEISVFVLTDGKDYVLLPAAKDYKRVGEGDTGPNTGGMGAVSPVPFADADLMARIEEQAIRPTLRGIQAEGLDYKGFIFFGFMISGGQPYLLEYNVRMGDPETEVVMPRLRSDLVELFEAALEGRLGDVQPDIDPRVCATVMMVSGGYPGAYDKGKAITGLEHADPDAMIFHAGTRLDDVLLLTDGGRVLACSAYGSTIPEAVSQALAQAGQIQFEGAYFRRDIGQDLMR
jgi:phosphoribosylamine--glycine ligase